MSGIYAEDTLIENVSQEWNDAEITHSLKTHRDTLVEMVQRPKWGTTCYMNRVIQSCELDEELYHETLVHPAMSCACSHKRVMIVGGGEGATAREVLKWPDVETIDMYEWDRDVVTLFSDKYPQWAKGAWESPKLTIHYKDIFEEITNYPKQRYDVIIIDLFDPSEEDKESWNTLLYHIQHWRNYGGVIVCYAGMRSMTDVKQPYQKLYEMIRNSPLQLYEYKYLFDSNHITHTEVIPYHVFVPSFLGESTFILIKSRAFHLMFDKTKKISHITKDIWKSYKSFNW